MGIPIGTVKQLDLHRNMDGVLCIVSPSGALIPYHQEEGGTYSTANIPEALAPDISGTPDIAGNLDKINVNTAPLSRLMEIKGIGPKTGAKIINRRQSKAFESVAEFLDEFNVEDPSAALAILEV